MNWIGVLRSAATLLSSRHYDRQQCDDLVQEAITRAIESGAAVRHPRAYVRRAARNIAIDEARKVSARGGASLPLEGLSDRQVPWIDPDQETSLALKQIVLGLPVPYRDVFVLNRFLGLSYQEIAAERGLTVKSVEYRMSRALALCAQALSD